MDKDDLKKYKEKLGALEIELTGQIAEHEKPVDFGSDIDSGDEEVDEAEEIDRQLTLAADLEKRLNQVKAALKKLEEEKYGACERCGEEIERAILDIDPESQLCGRCKQLGSR